MIIFGFEVRRYQPPKQVHPKLHMQHAVRELTNAWDNCRSLGMSDRPWIDWEKKEIIIVSHRMEVVYAPSTDVNPDPRKDDDAFIY